MRYKRYQYAVHNSSGLMVGGTMTFLLPMSVGDATFCIAQEAARIAMDMKLGFDPFNLNIAVKPLRIARSKKKVA